MDAFFPLYWRISVKSVIPFLVVLALVLGTCVSSEAGQQQQAASCSGAVQAASCSGSYATKEVILRRAPIRTWLHNRQPRVRNLFRATLVTPTSCSSSLSCGG